MHRPAIDLSSEEQRHHKATAIRFIEAFNQDEWDTVREVVAADYVYHHPIGGTVPAGPEGMVDAWSGFKTLSPDSWHPIPILIAEGDHLAVLLPTYGHFTGRAEHAPPPTGGRLDYGMVNMVRFAEGRLAEMWFGMDSLVEMQQMGVAPPAELRTYTPEENANLAAFEKTANVRRAPYDTVTAFGDVVVALGPPQQTRDTATMTTEIYRFAAGSPSLVYTHEVKTEPPYGGDPSVDSEASRGTVQRWLEEVLRRHDVDALGQIVAPHILVHPTAMPCEARFYGLPGVRTWLTEQWSAFPDLTIGEYFTVAHGDIVAARWEARGTSRGSFLGLPATGEGVAYTGVSMYRIENGKITEIWETRNTLGILHQLNPELGGGHHH